MKAGAHPKARVFKAGIANAIWLSASRDLLWPERTLPLSQRSWPPDGALIRGDGPHRPDGRNCSILGLSLYSTFKTERDTQAHTGTQRTTHAPHTTPTAQGQNPSVAYHRRRRRTSTGRPLRAVKIMWPSMCSRAPSDSRSSRTVSVSVRERETAVVLPVVCCLCVCAKCESGHEPSWFMRTILLLFANRFPRPTALRATVTTQCLNPYRDLSHDPKIWAHAPAVFMHMRKLR